MTKILGFPIKTIKGVRDALNDESYGMTRATQTDLNFATRILDAILCTDPTGELVEAVVQKLADAYVDADWSYGDAGGPCVDVAADAVCEAFKGCMPGFNSIDFIDRYNDACFEG